MIELVNRETGELLDTDSVPGLAEVAALHDERIERLGELVEELLDQDRATTGGAHAPVVWDRLTPQEAERTWRALATWVGWLRRRYPLAHRVPVCWWRHPELVEELTALWLAWRDAYVEKGASLSAGADWHGRCLPDFLRRLGAGGWNLACEGDHRPTVTSLYDARSVDNDEEFQHYIAASRHGAAASRGDIRMEHDQMARAVDAGEARIIGDLPDAPVALAGQYWQRDGEDWVPVRSQETIAFLKDAERRLRLADKAVSDAEKP